MQNGFNFDLLLDTLAERVAAKLAERQATAPAPSVKRRLLTVEEAGAYLGRSREAIQHLIAEGRIQPVRIDRRVFIDLRDLDRLIEASKG